MTAASTPTTPTQALLTDLTNPNGIRNPSELVQEVTAHDILIDTVLRQPGVFMGRTLTLEYLRDEVVHPYDWRCLIHRYGGDANAQHTATSALANAIQQAGWVQNEGTGITMKFTVQRLPNLDPQTLPEALQQLRTMEGVHNAWKDMANTLIEMGLVLRSMTQTVDEAGAVVDRTLALALLYREQSKQKHEQLRETGITHALFADIIEDDLETFLADPGAFIPNLVALREEFKFHISSQPVPRRE